MQCYVIFIVEKGTYPHFTSSLDHFSTLFIIIVATNAIFTSLRVLPFLLDHFWITFLALQDFLERDEVYRGQKEEYF